MDWWLIAPFAGSGLLLALRLWAGPAPVKPRAPPADAPPLEDEELWTAEALARLGTEATVADLVAQGRAEELRGLGYRGDLPE